MVSLRFSVLSLSSVAVSKMLYKTTMSNKKQIALLLSDPTCDGDQMGSVMEVQHKSLTCMPFQIKVNTKNDRVFVSNLKQINPLGPHMDRQATPCLLSVSGSAFLIEQKLENSVWIICRSGLRVE